MILPVMDEVVIFELFRYLDEKLQILGRDASNSEFLKRSYSRWAVSEMIGHLMDRPGNLSEFTIDDLILRFCERLYSGTKHRIMFAIGIDACMDARNYLRLHGYI